MAWGLGHGTLYQDSRLQGLASWLQSSSLSPLQPHKPLRYLKFIPCSSLALSDLPLQGKCLPAQPSRSPHPTCHVAPRGSWCTCSQPRRGWPSLHTFSPVRATMSRGPYMNRPTRTWGPSSAAMTSLARWLAVTFWKDRNQLSLCKRGWTLHFYYTSLGLAGIMPSYELPLEFRRHVPLGPMRKTDP